MHNKQIKKEAGLRDCSYYYGRYLHLSNLMSQRSLYLTFFLIGIIPFYVNGYVNSLIYESPILFWGFELFTWIVVPIGVLYVLTRYADLNLQEVGFKATIFQNGQIEHIVVVGIIYALIGYFLYSMLLFVGTELFPGGSLFHYQQVVPENGPRRFLVALYFGISAALVEEFYFRGLIYKVSRLFKYSVIVYLCFSPLLFSFAHWENGLANVFATYIMGLVSAILFLWFRNIWPMVISHLFIDYLYFG